MSESSQAAAVRIRAVREAVELQKAGHTTLAVRKLDSVISSGLPLISDDSLRALRESWQAKEKVR